MRMITVIVNRCYAFIIGLQADILDLLDQISCQDSLASTWDAVNPERANSAVSPIVPLG